MTTASESSKSTGPMFNASAMCGSAGPRMAGTARICRGLTSSAVGSPASLFPWPGDAEARRMLAGSGRRCFELWLHSGQGGSWRRTLLGLCFSTVDGFSTRLMPTWRAKVTKHSRRLFFQLAPSVHGTSDTEFSFWPTLTVAAEAPNKGSNKKKYPRSLKEAVLLPTLSARDWRSGKNKSCWGNSRPLNEILPTLQAHDSQRGHVRRLGRHGTKHGDRNLNDQIGGPLNPAWLEWYMGFPIAWTELPRSATRSSHKSRSGSEGES